MRAFMIINRQLRRAQRGAIAAYLGIFYERSPLRIICGNCRSP